MPGRKYSVSSVRNFYVEVDHVELIADRQGNCRAPHAEASAVNKHVAIQPVVTEKLLKANSGIVRHEIEFERPRLGASLRQLVCGRRQSLW